jgi:transposase-like protein
MERRKRRSFTPEFKAEVVRLVEVFRRADRVIIACGEIQGSRAVRGFTSLGATLRTRSGP